MTIKVCNKCGVEKPLDQFYFRKDYQRYRNDCKQCFQLKNAEWAKNNIERSREIKNNYNKRNPEKRRVIKARYRANNPIGYRKWNLENPDKVKEINRLYSKNNKHKGAASAAKRRAMKAKATPAWADSEAMQSIYMEAQYFGLEVDHIVPIDNPLVCGLHCESNLQLLTTTENRSKGNKLIEGCELI